MSPLLLHAGADSRLSPTDALARLLRTLRAGTVYRREDLAKMSRAIDRHLRQLLDAGVLQKVAQGLYYAPRQSAFGALPPEDSALVAAFLRDDDFLIFSPASYNTLGLGATQLYNRTIVYNRKRHGLFTFGNRQFDFRVKPRFPKKLTPEFLFVDLLNNLDELAEDREALLVKARQRAAEFEPGPLARALTNYGSMLTKKLVTGWLRT